MKRNLDLAREILLAVEASDDSPLGWVKLDLPNHTAEEVSYNVVLLADAGLIEAQDLSSMDGYEWYPKRLTWEGHEFLDDIRDPTIWRKTKEGAATAGSESMKFVWEIAKAYGRHVVKEKLGLDLPL